MLRIEKGSPTEAELAAVVAVLLCGSGVVAETEADRRVVALWRRPERARGFQGPRSWRSGSEGGELRAAG